MTTTDEIILYSNSRYGLGIQVLGAKNASGIYIKQVLDGGLAQKDGRLQIGDQILSINNQTSIDISREHAVNILRCAAATGEVYLYVRHFFPSLSSTEYQKLLHDEIPMRRRSIRKQEQHKEDQIFNGDNIFDKTIQSLLNSRFQIIDLVNLLKKTYPKVFANEKKRELQWIQQLSKANTDGRITLKDFEQQSSILLGECINLLLPFYSLSTNKNQFVLELHHQIASCRSLIDELQNNMVICEESQRLSEDIEIEYEDLLKFVDEQRHQNKINEDNQIQQIRASEQLIQKLFNYFSTHVNQPNAQHILSQFIYEYEQQQLLPSDYLQNNNGTSVFMNTKYS